MSKMKTNEIDRIAQFQNIINKYERDWASEIAEKKGDPDGADEILRRLHEERRQDAPKRDK